MTVQLAYRIGYRTPTGSRGGLGASLPLAIVTDVPDTITRDQVEMALETWARWPSWRARMGAGSRVEIARVYMGGGETIADGVEAVAWSDISPAVKTITVPVDGQLWVRATQCARRADKSLREWTAEAIAYQVETEESRDNA